MLKSAFRARLFRCLALAAVASSVPLVHADQFGLLNAVDPDFNDLSAWFNFTTSSSATTLPGINDYVGFQSYNNVGSTRVNLRDDRHNDSGQLYELEFNLNLNNYTITNSFDMYSAKLADGTFSANYLTVYDNGALLQSSLWNLTASGIGFSQSDGKMLVQASNMTFDYFSQGRGAEAQFSTNSNLTAKNGYLNGNVGVDATSSLTFLGSGTPDIYASSMDSGHGTLDIEGELSTVGATVARYDALNPALATINVKTGGDWTDNSDSIVSVGFGGIGTLNVDGGVAFIKSGLRVGEGNYYIDPQGGFVGVTGTGELNVSNGGYLETSGIGLSGQYRNLTLSGLPIATSSGTLNVTTNGFVKTKSIEAFDNTGIGQTYARINVNTGGTLEVGSLIGGALNLNPGEPNTQFSMLVSDGGTYRSSFTQIIGGSGPQPTARFTGAATTVEINRLGSYVGADVTFDGVTAKIGNIQVGQDDTPGAFVTVKNTALTFDGDASLGDFRTVNARGGSLTFDGGSMSIPTGKTVGFTVGSFTTATQPGTLTFKDATLNGVANIFVGDKGTLKVTNSSIDLLDGAGPVRNSLFVSGALGKAEFRGSSLSSWRLSLGRDAGSSADVVMRDTSYVARADTYTATSPGSVIIGNFGRAKLEMFNSSISAPRFYIGTQGLLKGDGRLNGITLASGLPLGVFNYGTVSPGHSAGHLAIDGDFTNNGILEIEIDLANPSSFDYLTVTGSIQLGGTLKLIPIGTGTFDPTKSYTFLGGSSILGSFSSFEIDPAFGITASAFSMNSGGYFGINPTTTPVPEPATMITLGLGVAAILRRRRKG